VQPVQPVQPLQPNANAGANKAAKKSWRNAGVFGTQ
jgi:hypothetical protein